MESRYTIKSSYFTPLVKDSSQKDLCFLIIESIIMLSKSHKKGFTTMKINLNTLTTLEKQFVVAAVKEWNDLMFTDDINSGIEKSSLGGVVGSLVKKGIIEVYASTSLSGNGDRFIGEFQFVGDDGSADFDNEPELVEA